MSRKKPEKSNSWMLAAVATREYSHNTARRFFGSLSFRSSLLYFAHADFENSANIEVVTGGCFNKCTTELFRRPLSVLCRDLSLFDIIFSAHNDAGDGVFTDKVSDLVVNDLDHLEGFAGSD